MSAPDAVNRALNEVLPELALGSLLGFAAGAAVRFVGQAVLITVGIVFIGIQLLAYYDVVTVDWLRLQSLTEPWLRGSGENFRTWFSRVMTHQLPFAGTFVAGFILGLRVR